MTDGDTVTLLAAGKAQIKVRLEGIDAPEKGQEFGTKAREALAKKAQGKEVRLRVTGKDRSGHTLGVLFLGDEDVNLSLLRNGWAW